MLFSFSWCETVCCNLYDYMVLDWKSGESLSLIVVDINAIPIERDSNVTIEDT